MGEKTTIALQFFIQNGKKSDVLLHELITKKITNSIPFFFHTEIQQNIEESNLSDKMVGEDFF